MILFFHFICLLARYIVSNISKSISRRKVHSTDKKENEAIFCQSSDYLRNKKGYIKHPIYINGSLKFFPPVYVQRYETVALILQDPAYKGQIQKVVDFGCAELGFFLYLKNIEGVTEILEIDINVDLLERYAIKAAPLTSDYLMSKCTKPLDVSVLAGNIADYDDYLMGTDAVVALELIEHLSEEAFNKMPYNIFHLIKPKLAVFTTPNADFNSLFSNFTDVRHSDHKFEWTRREFYVWTQEIIQQYPDYCVRFYGIGAGPKGTENLGCCTQMAVFQRMDNSEVFSSAREKETGVHNYKLIKHFTYPMYEDPRTMEEKILHEIQYQVSHINAMPNYYNYEENEIEIPLSLLREYVSDLCPDKDEFRNILEKSGRKLVMKNDSWYMLFNESDFESSEKSYGGDDWLNVEIMSIPNSKGDADFGDENWDWNSEQLYLDEMANFQTARSSEDLKADQTEINDQEYYFNSKTDCTGTSTEKVKSAPESCNQLLTHLGQSKSGASGFKSKISDPRKLDSMKSKIPRKKCTKESVEEKSNLSNVCKPRRKISKSCSLDSCLENINCKPFEFESYLISGGSVPCRDASWMSSKKSKHRMNDSGSSLFSSSLDRAADSGYPFSFTPPDADYTPEQVDDLFTEMSRSSSASSEVEMMGGLVPPGAHHDVFLEDVVVENGDLANNNRDGEGNNVEGLMGERLVNEIAAERDPNDNMFFPGVEEFPPWLLNLGELARRPIYHIPLDGNYDDEGVGDDSSSDYNQSLDSEDLDFYFESLE